MIGACLVYTALYTRMRSQRLVPATELAPADLLRSQALNPNRQGYHAYTEEPASCWFRPLMWLDAKVCRTPIILEDGPYDHGDVTYIEGVPVIIEKTERFQQAESTVPVKAAPSAPSTVR